MNTLLVFLVALALSMTSAAPVGRLPERIAAAVDLTDKFSAISIDNLGMQRIDNVSVEKKDGKGSHAFPSDILDWNSVRGILSSLESSMAPEHISLEPRYITFENTTNSNIVLVDDPTVIDMAGDKNWSSSRIYNGAIVQNDDIFANVGVMVAIDDQNNVLGTTCTGSIVDENIVLSAAHCVDDLPAGVRLAMCAGTKDFFANHGVCALITEAIIPAQYSLETITIGNDLAILKLSRPMTGIPIMKVSFDLPPAGFRSLAIGFGLSAPGMDNPDGRMRYGDTVVVPSGQCGFLQRGGLAGDPDLICSNGNHDGSRGTACNGDSGGPLLVPGNTPSEHIVIGVASYVAKFQDGSCDPGHENVYASLTSTAHKNFIRESVVHFGGSLTFAQISGGGNPPPAQSQPPSPPQQTPPQQTQPPSQQDSCQQRFNACRPELLTCLENNLTSSCCDATIPVIQCLIPVFQACGNADGANNLRGILGQLRQVCPTIGGPPSPPQQTPPQQTPPQQTPPQQSPPQQTPPQQTPPQQTPPQQTPPQQTPPQQTPPQQTPPQQTPPQQTPPQQTPPQQTPPQQTPPQQTPPEQTPPQQTPPQQTPPQQTQPPSQPGSCQQRFHACRPEQLTCLENNLTSSCCDATIPVIQCLIPVLQTCGNPDGANNLRGILGQLREVCPTIGGPPSPPQQTPPQQPPPQQTPPQQTPPQQTPPQQTPPQQTPPLHTPPQQTPPQQTPPQQTPPQQTPPQQTPPQQTPPQQTPPQQTPPQQTPPQQTPPQQTPPQQTPPQQTPPQQTPPQQTPPQQTPPQQTPPQQTPPQQTPPQQTQPPSQSGSCQQRFNACRPELLTCLENNLTSSCCDATIPVIQCLIPVLQACGNPGGANNLRGVLGQLFDVCPTFSGPPSPPQQTPPQQTPPQQTPPQQTPPQHTPPQQTPPQQSPPQQSPPLQTPPQQTPPQQTPPQQTPPQQTPPQQTQPPSQPGSCQQRFNACRPELLTCLENNLTSSCCDATIPVIQCLIPVLQACGNPGGANNLRGVLGQLFDVCPTTSGTTA